MLVSTFKETLREATKHQVQRYIYMFVQVENQTVYKSYNEYIRIFSYR